MILGVDTHKRNHTFVSVDGNGRQLKVLTGSTTTEANLAALRWAIAQSDDRLWSVEDNRSMSRRLERDLLLAGERVVRVSTKMMSNCRDGARTYGKSDPIDALAIEINELKREISERVAGLAPALFAAGRVRRPERRQSRGADRRPDPVPVRRPRSPATTGPHRCRCGPRTTNGTASAAPATANSTAPSTSQRSPKSDATHEHESSTAADSNKATGPWKHSASSIDASPTPSSAPLPPTRTSKFAPLLDRRATHRTTPRSLARLVRNGSAAPVVATSARRRFPCCR